MIAGDAVPSPLVLEQHLDGPADYDPTYAATLVPSVVATGGGPVAFARPNAPVDRDALAKPARAWLRLNRINPAAVLTGQAGGFRLIRPLAVRAARAQSGTPQALPPVRFAVPEPRPWDEDYVIS